jgi:hypothetical protein
MTKPKLLKLLLRIINPPKMITNQIAIDISRFENEFKKSFIKIHFLLNYIAPKTYQLFLNKIEV